MRYVEGTNLRDLIARQGPLDVEHAVFIVGQVGRALDAANRRGLVHRDVKPGNILIVPSASGEGTDYVYLTDFGLTKHASEDSGGLTSTGQFLGTIDFIAPEQVLGQTIDGRADQYSLACVMYTCLTGHAPFLKEAEVATIYAHLNDPPPKVGAERSGLPRGFDDVVTRAMAKRPEDRYPSCGAMVADLTVSLAAAETSGSLEFRSEVAGTEPSYPPSRPIPEKPSSEARVSGQAQSKGKGNVEESTGSVWSPYTPEGLETLGPPASRIHRGRGRAITLSVLLTLVVVVGVVAALFVRHHHGAASPTQNPPAAAASMGSDNIFVMNADGTGVTRLTNGPGGNQSPDWSPDQTQIVFVSDREGTNQVYVMNADGSHVTSLTQGPSINSAPVWSKDGRHIAFVSNRDGNLEVYVMASNGTGLIDLTMNAAADFDPAWSSDGRRIAFVSDRAGNNEIFVMNTDGSHLTRLTINPAEDRGPEWSPDGTLILFRRGLAGSREIYLLRLLGSGTRTDLTNNPADDFAPSWASDGRRIVFVSDRDGNDEIYLMNPDGGDVTRLTIDPAKDSSPVWSHDGSHIVFISDRK
jgi:serine/threonine protein kinase